jgi:hypothetical protein
MQQYGVKIIMGECNYNIKGNQKENLQIKSRENGWAAPGDI